MLPTNIPFLSNHSDNYLHQDIPVSLHSQHNNVSLFRDGKVDGFSIPSHYVPNGGHSVLPTSQTLIRNEYSMTASQGKQIQSQDLPHPFPNPKPIAITSTESENWSKPNTKPDPSAKSFPSQDLISEGLQMLKMSPPSGHSSPLRVDPPSGLDLLTLGNILRVAGGWDGLREGTQEGDEEFGEFREIQPSFDDTKTTS